MTKEINIYKNVFSTQVEKTVELDKWFSNIKNGNKNHLNSILKAREIGKGHKEYESLKKSVPCITYNFLFKEKKSKTNIVSATGIMYIDIDSVYFNIESINKDKVFAYYKSFGGQGYSILVKVEGLTEKNFSTSYKAICEDLDIYNFIDLNAIKSTQFSVLSYDENIFVNYNSKQYIATEKSEITPILHNNEKRDRTPILGRKEKKEKVRGSVPFLELSFCSKLDKYNEECVYVKEGKMFVECKLPFNNDGSVKKITEGRRNTIISAFINNIVFLNPEKEKKQNVFSFVKKINELYFEPSLPENEVIMILNRKYKLLDEGVLEPSNPTTKYYWTEPSINNKHKAYTDKKVNNTTDKINEFFGDIICNINEKVTYKTISNFTELSEKTIKRRLTEEQKRIIKEYNKQLKN